MLQIKDVRLGFLIFHQIIAIRKRPSKSPHRICRFQIKPVAYASCGVQSVLETFNFFKIAPMDQEQFRIADQNIVLSTIKAKEILGWHPKYNDSDMLVVAFEDYCRVTKN